MTTLAVIGANGKSGQAFVALALSRGYAVRAAVHRHTTLRPQANLTLISVDATKRSDLPDLLADADVVVSLIGHGRKSPPHLQADMVRALIPEMRTAGITRLISLTGSGVRLPADTPSLVDRLLHVPLKLAIGAIIRDGVEHYHLLQASPDIDWTVLRALILTNGRKTSHSLREHGPATTFVSRATVALAALDVIEQSSFIRQAPVIGKK